MDRIDEIFNVLVQYEKAIDNNDMSATLDSYLGYVDKLYVRYFGQNHSEISAYLKGLYLLGADAHHDTVKRVVFDIIHILEKE